MKNRASEWNKDRPHRSGFTALELLVVLTGISLVVALILPAVQQSREASRAAQCRHRMRQLGLASHAFHETHKEFPSGAVRMWALLPFVEQAPLYESLANYSPFTTATQESIPEDRPANVTTYICPSSQASPSSFDFSYFVNGGNFWTGLNQDRSRQTSRRNGMFSTHWISGGVRIRDVFDGTSNTAFYSETRRPWGERTTRNVPGYSNDLSPFYWQLNRVPASTQEFSVMMEAPDEPYNHHANRIQAQFNTLVYGFDSHIGLPNRPSCRIPRKISKTFRLAEAVSPSSNHKGGVNVLNVDGSVNFVSEDIDRNVWIDLGSRDSRMTEPMPE